MGFLKKVGPSGAARHFQLGKRVWFRRVFFSSVLPGSTKPKIRQESAASVDDHPEVIRHLRAPQRPHQLLRSARSAARCAAELPSATICFFTPLGNLKNQNTASFFIHRAVHRSIHRINPDTLSSSAQSSGLLPAMEDAPK
jgi:hypothetical protein